MKIKWSVSPVPTGRYRSFEKRGWPTAEYEDQQPAAWIRCEGVSYNPANAKIGDHPPLALYIADYSESSNGGNCPWTRRKVKRSFSTVKEAKEWFSNFCKNHPEIMPKSVKP